MSLLRLIIVLVIQVLILNQIHLFGYVTPIFVGYVLLCLPKKTSRIMLLLWGFIVGLLFDMFSNTAGMATAACTALGMFRNSLMSPFTPRDTDDMFHPTVIALGATRYFIYSLSSMFVVHAIFYGLDALSLHDWQLTLLSIIGSTIFAALLCLFAELIVRKRK